jgi:hypothetical protein
MRKENATLVHLLVDIEQLRQEVDYAAVVIKHYIRERNYFKSTLYQYTQDKRTFERPTSPPLERPSLALLNPPSPTTRGSEGPYTDCEEELGYNPKSGSDFPSYTLPTTWDRRLIRSGTVSSCSGSVREHNCSIPPNRSLAVEQ